MQDLSNQELPGMEQGHEASGMQDETPKKGVKTKLFGVGLIFLGALDSMLFWRGGLVVNDFYLLLFVLGCIIYMIGSIRGGDRANGRASSAQTDLKE